MTRHLPIITTSEIKTFQRCQRLHHYRYTLGFRPVERAHALEFGSLVHTGLEAWWKTAGDLDAARMMMATAHADSGLDALDLTRADVMLCGYHARWLDEPITVLAVEHEFRVPIEHPDGRRHFVDLVGKFDALCTIEGLVYIPEHKTKSAAVETGAYFEQLRADLQIGTYLIAATALGHSPGGALYDVLVKPDEPKRATPVENRKYTKEGKLYARQRDADETEAEYRERLTNEIAAKPDDYYQRATVLRLDHELDQEREDLFETVSQIVAARTRLYHPRNPGACRAFSRNCEYWETCWRGASLEDSGKFVKLENPHEEISHAIGIAAEE